MDRVVEISLPLNAEWARIEHVRDAASAAVLAVFGDRVLRDAVSMVSAELLENAVKYGSWRGTDDPRIGYRLFADGPEIRVAVTSRLSLEDEESRRHFDALQATLRWLSEFSDARDAFRERLETFYDNPESGRPMLGLARVAYEGGCGLRCDLSGEGYLTVEATFRP